MSGLHGWTLADEPDRYRTGRDGGPQTAPQPVLHTTRARALAVGTSRWASSCRGRRGCSSTRSRTSPARRWAGSGWMAPSIGVAVGESWAVLDHARGGGRTPCGGPGVPGPGSSTMNLGVLAQRAHQCFGHRAGWMSDDAGERVPADGVLGWAEDAVNRWSGGLWWGEKAQPARSSSTSPTSSPSAIPQGGQLSGVKPSVR